MRFPIEDHPLEQLVRMEDAYFQIKNAIRQSLFCIKLVTYFVDVYIF